jgi:acetyl-CoA carboxylase biotin carboxylase subunit
VRESLRLATGEPLQHNQAEIVLRGTAIECRINAEDPQKNFMPAPGTVNALQLPAGPGVRVDTHLYEGYSVPPYYDSLLAKVVVWDCARPEAIERMKRALGEFEVEGLKTTKPLHLALLDDEGFRVGEYHTGYLEANLSRIVSGIAD